MPLAVDLFCGLGGWADGLLTEGFRVIGFDNERHQYGEARYPAQLVIQDVLTLHGRQFKDAALIVASPPCQEFSYMAMPWTRAKEKARQLREGPPEDRARLTALFDACFRIQKEACAAAGRHIPLVVENVRGAQPWVGRAAWAFGSFLLWGDVPALMPIVTKRRMKFPADCGPRMWSEREYVRLNDGNASAFHQEGATKVGGFSWSDYGKPGYKAIAFNGEADRRLREATKNDGGSWFAVANNTTSGHGQNPDGRKAPNGTQWFNDGARTPDSLASMGGKSKARKAASAHIAKIPLPLARWIARAWYPYEDVPLARAR